MDRILLVEDSPTQAQKLAEMLTAKGLEVAVAASGAEALTVARTMRPDVVLLDLYLPDVSGELVFRQLRQEEDTARVPVVVITSSEDHGDRLRLLELGADDFLTKPVDPLELVVRLRTLLRAKRLSDRLLLSFLELDRMGRFAETFAAEGVADWTALAVADALARELLGESPGSPDHPQFAWAAMRAGSRLLATTWFWRQGRWFRKQRVYRCLDIARALSPYALGEGRYVGKQPMDTTLAALLGFPTDPPPQNFVAAAGSHGYLLLAGYPWEVGVWEFPILRAAFRLWAVFERLRLEARRQELAFFSALEALALAAEFYDRDTADHVQRVAILARETARTLGCPPRFVRWIGPSARVHDVGKMSVPLELVMKTGPLSPEEDQLMRQHTVNGAKLLGSLPQLEMARNIALYHHENFDGSGYPRGLAGDAIPLEARIVRVVDVYDALRSYRAYKPALSHEEAVMVLKNGDSRVQPGHFDPMVRDSFLHTLPRYLYLYPR